MVKSKSSKPVEKAIDVDRITKGLQDVVKQHFLANEDPETLTINNIRTKAEQALDLSPDFLKNDGFWKAESKNVIREEVNRQNSEIEQQQQQHQQQHQQQEPEEQEKQQRASLSSPRKAAARKKATSNKANASGDKGEDELGNGEAKTVARKPKRTRKGAKEADTIGKNERKKAVVTTNGRKKNVEPEHQVEDQKAEKEKVDEGEQEDEEDDEIPRNKRRRTSRVGSGSGQPSKEVDGQGDSDDGKKGATEETTEEKAEVTAADAEENSEDPSIPKKQQEQDVSESEMSEVLDLTPQKKKRGGSAAKSKPEQSRRRGSSSSKAKKQTKTKKKEVVPLSADEERIKALQGWLLKCGIRKQWTKELQPFPTAREKTQHLKGLLEEIGMTGRYSAEKAKRIKEERELAAEVEAVQAGASSWGLETSSRTRSRAGQHDDEGKAGLGQRRTSRSGNTLMQGDGDGEIDDGDGGGGGAAARRRLIRPELAFLDDQSDSSE